MRGENLRKIQLAEKDLAHLKRLRTVGEKNLKALEVANPPPSSAAPTSQSPANAGEAKRDEMPGSPPKNEVGL